MKPFTVALLAAAMTMVAGSVSAQCPQRTVKSVAPPPGGANISGNKSGRSGANTRMRPYVDAHEDYSGAWLDESSVRVKRQSYQSVGRHIAPHAP